ncbi:hypothetical protein [Undibacterium crateris]|uniref:hypothetical protein n=1 Tax=Undibacterium crateris TaxID=2528175 RepID=UPI001389B13A|nr:hypothetical protein [Undibacterium crateris]NDI84632.1 hypothetical protein [Undibacterium crateris]
MQPQKIQSSIFSRLYCWGWAIPIALYMLPIAEFPDLSYFAVFVLFVLVFLGYAVIKSVEKKFRCGAQLNVNEIQGFGKVHRSAVFFSLLSIIGCQLVLSEQANYIGGLDFGNLQERYITLVESSLDGTATSSFFSAIGNLFRSFFFIALSSLVVYSKVEKSKLKITLVSILVVFAISLNFFVNVSRLQLVFYILVIGITAELINHPFIRNKRLIFGVTSILILFILMTTNQRFEAKFGDLSLAAGYIAGYFGIKITNLGAWVIEYLGLATYTIAIYLTQGIPELLRLISFNASPYSLGAHSFFLVISPFAKIIGVKLGENGPEISNQGAWWGFMGDLYLDFGFLFPILYLVVIAFMIVAALKIRSKNIYGLAFQSLTGAMIFVIPYSGIFNTYAVSYFGLLFIAIYKKRA